MLNLAWVLNGSPRAMLEMTVEDDLADALGPVDAAAWGSAGP